MKMEGGDVAAIGRHVLAELDTATSSVCNECDGGVVVRVSGQKIELWAWQWVAGCVELSQATDDSVSNFSQRLATELRNGSLASVAQAASCDESLRSIWHLALCGNADLAADDDSTLAVLITKGSSQDVPPATQVAPIRVGRYHYCAEHRAPKATLQILERDARTPAAELRDAGGLGACAAGNLAGAKALAAAGWPVLHAVDKFGSNALMWAASYGRCDIARWLVEEMVFDVDRRNKVGRTALMFACKYAAHTAYGHELVRYLIEEAHADVTVRMKDESAAFDWAVYGGTRTSHACAHACAHACTHAHAHAHLHIRTCAHSHAAHMYMPTCICTLAQAIAPPWSSLRPIRTSMWPA